MTGIVDALYKRILLAAHPVGCIYQSLDATSPAAIFGGTWEQIEGRFLLAAGSTYAAGSTGGEAYHTLSVYEMPSHRHEGLLANGDPNYEVGYDPGSMVTSSGYLNVTHGNVNFRIMTDHTGGGAAHNNMPPYLAVYMWRRVS